ncbi:gastrotropin-like [Osmerus mordax]|uniref:gastrotropin-like n=1 Tax=Osmerus mordax TaxID=8014 RepID=UPI00350FB11D
MFKGTYEVESVEKRDEFYEALGTGKPETMQKVTELSQTGMEITWTHPQGPINWTNKITIGKECELTTRRGLIFKAIPAYMMGTLIVQCPAFLFTAQIVEGKLIETYTVPGEKGVTMKKVSIQI